MQIMECPHKSDGKDEAREMGPEDVLTRDEAALLARARDGQWPCPRCQRTLYGEFVFHRLEGDDFYAGVKLSCLCGFVEY